MGNTNTDLGGSNDRRGSKININNSYTSIPLLDNDGSKPSLLMDFDNKKTQSYYLKEAKWALNNAFDYRHVKWLNEIAIIRSFYKGDQWVYEEDISSFLKDESDNSRNRIKMVHNVFRPMIEQYRGNSIRMAINATVKSISNKAYTRREKELKEKLLLTDVANEFPDGLGTIIRDQNPEIGKNKEDTTETFNNVYTDKYVEKLNYLLQYVSELNEFKAKQKHVAVQMAFSGLSAVYCYEHAGHMRTQIIESEDFFFDRNAKREDLQDSSFMGFRRSTVLTSILEKFQGLSDAERQALRNHVSASGDINMEESNKQQNNNFTIYTVFFKSTIEKKAGYVQDDSGNPYLIFLDEEDSITGKTYTKDDLVDPPKKKSKKLKFNGSKSTRMVLEVVEKCVFISGNEIGYSTEDSNGRDVVTDIVLEYGQVDYSETNWTDPSYIKFPIKVHTWALVDGEVLSPMSDSLNPQRFLNRIISATEGQINAAGGAGPIFDSDMFDDADHEMETATAVKQGKAAFVRSKGRGINNSVGAYDNTVKAGTYQMFEIVNVMKKLIQDTSGVNEGLKGESTGDDQLVGVTKLLIQRGSLMQEPFYEAIASIFVQVHQFTASSGLRMYLDNDRNLEIATGEEGVKVFKLSEGMRHENFRTFVKRDNDPEMMKAQADQTLMGLLQAQIIDIDFYSEMVGRSSTDQIHSKLRTFSAKKKEEARKAEEEALIAQEEAMQQESIQQEQMMAQEEEREIQQQTFDASKLEAQQNHEMDKITAKGVIDNANSQGL